MADGEASVGSIIGYLRLNRDDWIAGIASTRRDIADLNGSNPDIRIRTNSTDTVAQLATVKAATDSVGSSAKSAGDNVQFNLIAALAAVAPAAIPIAGVAGGALIGLIPLFATVKLGIAGITNEYKSGALEGTKYGADIDTLKGELTQLQTIAAGGILKGIDQGLAASHGLFPAVNTDIKAMSGYLGEIIAGGAPALLNILVKLNPLLETFGHDVADGAQNLENWATSSDGITKFVTYVQAELPEVQQLLGELVVLVAHLVTAAAPFGGALLTDITLLVGALDKIPIGVLQTAIPLTISLYVALKAYQGITAIVLGLNKAIAGMSAPFGTAATASAASTAAQTADQLRLEAGYAQMAAEISVANAAIARSNAETAAAMVAGTEGTISLFAGEGAAAVGLEAEMAAAYEGMNSLFASHDDRVAASTAASALAFQAEADAAVAAAAEIGLAATAAADAVVAEGETAAVGWSAMLGPIGAVVVGVGLLASAFFLSGHNSQAAAVAASSYADSLKKSTDALAAVNVQQTVDNLSKANAYTTLDKLNQANGRTVLSYSDLATAVNGSQQQFDGVIAKLKDVDSASIHTYGSGRNVTAGITDQTKQSQGLITELTTLRAGLDAQTKTQIALNKAMDDAQTITDGGTTAVANQAKAFGTNTQAYISAQEAAQQNTDTTNAQTLAFQLENNAAGLVNQALQTMAGQHLSNAEAQTALDQATLSLTASIKTNGSSIADNSAQGVANRQAIEGVVSAMQAKLTSEAAATGSSVKATTEYNKNATALLAQIGQLDGTKSAAYAYAQQLLKIPPVAKTKIDLDDAAAAAAVAQLRSSIFSLQNVVIPVQVAIKGGNLGSAELALKGYASGTNDAPGGPAWLAENGPELITLPPHAMVTPAPQTRSILAGNAGPGGATSAASSTDMQGLTDAVMTLANRPIVLNGRTLTQGLNDQNKLNARR